MDLPTHARGLNNDKADMDSMGIDHTAGNGALYCGQIRKRRQARKRPVHKLQLHGAS